MITSVRACDFSLSSVAVCLPDKTVDTHRWAARCGLPDADARAHALVDNGVMQFHDAMGESPVALAIRAVAALLRQTGTVPATVDTLIYTHTIQTSVIAPPASTLQQIQSETGLCHALAFSIAQQHCVSPMAAIHVLHALSVRPRPIERAIIVCADVIGSECDRLRAIQNLALHSDGACAMLLERNGAHNVVAGMHLYTDGRFFRGTDDELQPIPDDRYYWSAFSTMRSAIRQAGITTGDITHVLPHHVNLPGWARLMAMLSIPEERLYTANFARIGHVFGADPFINFHTCTDRDARGWSLLFSCGLSGCFGAVVIRHAHPLYRHEKYPRSCSCSHASDARCRGAGVWVDARHLSSAGKPCARVGAHAVRA